MSVEVFVFKIHIIIRLFYVNKVLKWIDLDFCGAKHKSTINGHKKKYIEVEAGPDFFLNHTVDSCSLLVTVMTHPLDLISILADIFPTSLLTHS